MAAALKEADHIQQGSSESEQDFVESDAPAPGEGANRMLIATDSYEDLSLHTYNNIEVKKGSRRTGSIAAISREGAVSETDHDQVLNVEETPSTEDEGHSSQDEILVRDLRQISFLFLFF